MPDIEPNQVGVYDDFQLEAIDQLMLETKARGRSSTSFDLPASMTNLL